MGVESAELVKHGVNAFLALSITFANELAGIAERVGADAAEVERGLKTERRIGARAYLRPGAAFAGGTLARDVDYLTQIGEREGVPTQLLGAVRASNDEHSDVGPADDRIARRRRETAGSTATSSASGGSSTSRERTRCAGRAAVELCRELARAGAIVKAHDPAVRVVPDDLSGRPHAVPDAARGGRRRLGARRSRPTGPRTARSTPSASWRVDADADRRGRERLSPRDARRRRRRCATSGSAAARA